MVDRRLADFSKALFENSYLLPVSKAIVVLEDGRFTQRQLAATLNLADNLVKTVLARLRLAGLAKDVGRAGGPKGGMLVERTPSVYWDWIEAISAEILGPEWRDF
jgi:hypothetical protein